MLLFMLLALAVPTGAQAVWSSPIALSSPGQLFQPPQVAVDQSGNAVFAWSRSDRTANCPVDSSGCDRVYARVRSATGSLSAVQTLSPAGQFALQATVAVDPAGVAIFVWESNDGTPGCPDNYNRGCYRVQVRVRSAAGLLSPVQTLSPAGQNTTDPHVGVDQNGNAIIAWTVTTGGVLARSRSATGVLGETETIGCCFGGDVAVDEAGDAVFAWQGNDTSTDCNGQGCRRTYARARSAAGALSPIQTLSAGGKDAMAFPRLGVDQSGDTVFVWTRYDGDTADCNTGLPNEGCVRVQARGRSATGALSAIQTLSAPGTDAAKVAKNPTVAVDPAGDAVFGWEDHRFNGTCGGSGCYKIQARARSAAGSLSAIQTLFTGRGVGFPDAGIDQSGNAVFVWDGVPGVEARTRSTAGVLGTTETLYDGPAVIGGYFPGVAVDPNGTAAAVWVGDKVLAAVGP
jgi:hypothetical protein